MPDDIPSAIMHTSAPLGARFLPAGVINLHIGVLDYALQKAAQLELRGNSNGKSLGQFEETWLFRVTLAFTRPAYLDAFSNWLRGTWLPANLNNIRAEVVFVPNVLDKGKVDVLISMLHPNHAGLVKDMLLHAITTEFGGKPPK